MPNITQNKGSVFKDEKMYQQLPHDLQMQQI